MGDVYGARDTALHRQVAIKILPKTLPTSPIGRRGRHPARVTDISAARWRQGLVPGLTVLPLHEHGSEHCLCYGINVSVPVATSAADQIRSLA